MCTCLFYDTSIHEIISRVHSVMICPCILDQASYRGELESITFHQMCGNDSNWCQVQRSEVSEGKLRCIHSKKRRGYGTGIIRA